MKKDSDDRFDLMAEFRRERKFSKHTLDDDVENQPVLFGRVADLHATALSDLKAIRADIDLAEAELYLQYKEQNASSEGGKLSEAHIKAKIEASNRVQKLRKQEVTTERRVNELLALKESYKERSYSIRGEIDLYTANYFSAEAGGSRRRDAVERSAEQTKKAYQERRTRRTTEDD